MSAMIDMTGWIMAEHGIPDSKIIVKERAEDYISPSGAHHVQWLCECLCEQRTRFVSVGRLIRNGSVKSCGCLQGEAVGKTGKNNKMYNKYDLSGEYGICYTSKGEEIWFDIDDYDKIKDICWWYDSNGYACGRDVVNNRIVKMHQLVFGQIPPGFIIDHKNHPNGKFNKTDNRKSNLRLVTKSENDMNAGYRKNNSSGKIGVYQTKYGTWRAYIQKKGVGIITKTFKSFDNAVQWRIQKEIELFGDYRYEANN